jgi:hypothetical protein
VTEFITLEHVYTELQNFILEQRQISEQTVALITDIQAHAAAITSKHADLEGRLQTIRTTLDMEFQKLAKRFEDNWKLRETVNQSQLDQLATALVTIESRVDTINNKADELNNDIGTILNKTPVP